MGVKAKPLIERFWSKVEITPACWLWRGVFRGSYGAIQIGGKGSLMESAHRLAYTFLVGPIPEGLQIDHLCRVRACVNPDHLEPVTLRENVLRGQSPMAENARKTHCKHGHAFIEGNIYTHPKRRTRHCRACLNRAAREYAKRQKV